MGRFSEDKKDDKEDENGSCDNCGKACSISQLTSCDMPFCRDQLCPSCYKTYDGYCFHHCARQEEENAKGRNGWF
jgi:hypothetical protein